MKRMIPGLALLMALLLLLTACGSGAQTPGADGEEAPDDGEKAPVTSDTLYVKPIEGLRDDFILGMDVSSVLAEEASGVKYYDFEGNERDLFEILAENGLNAIRVRVWNDPWNAEGHGYGGGNNDIDAAVEIGRRATAAGMKLIVDFHYSDFWADPGKQMAPKAWRDMDIETKTEAAYQYTRESLTKLSDAGVAVGMVQLGNETNGALCGEKTWFNIQYIMQAGARATREVYPEALVAVHFANPENADSYRSYASKLAYYDVDYDVFASSYYPYWHGTLENLSSILGEIAEQYGKQVMVMETSWANTAEDTDFSGNTIGDGGLFVKNHPFTVQGQANSVRDVIETVAALPSGLGVCYWEGAWISVGQSSWEENSAKWEQFGSGWASSYASEYDPDDAGRYYGGSAVDNQCFFDPSGHPYESLKLFALLREGNEIEPQVDALEDTFLTVDLNGTIELPATVNAVMTDDSRRAVDVSWNVTEEDLAKMYAGGPNKYAITGEAGGREALGTVSMVEYNFLANPGFEDGVLEPWVIEDLGGADQLYVEEKLTDSLSGTWHMHFWSAKKDSVRFTLEQEVEGLKSGQYRFTVSIMGGDCGESEIYAYIMLDGEIVATAPLSITSYGNWDTAQTPAVSYTEGQRLSVGVYVRCAGDGNGAWGKIDDAMLNSVG